MDNGIVALLYLAGLGTLFAVVYTANRKTPVPKGCEDIKADCGGCHDIACGNNPAHDN